MTQGIGVLRPGWRAQGSQPIVIVLHLSLGLAQACCCSAHGEGGEAELLGTFGITLPCDPLPRGTLAQLVANFSARSPHSLDVSPCAALSPWSSVSSAEGDEHSSLS